jgi:NAD(P)H-dependent FMN reductase
MWLRFESFNKTLLEYASEAVKNEGAEQIGQTDVILLFNLLALALVLFCV